MKEIKLTQGMIALVDDSDYENIKDIKCCVQKRKTGSRITYYAGINGGLLHKYLIGDIPDGFVIDHKDGNGLNNQRSNLRVCTRRQNRLNSLGTKNGSSKYKGVAMSGKKNFVASITVNGKYTIIGVFDNEIDAAIAYNIEAVNYFGQFARLNDIPGYNDINYIYDMQFNELKINVNQLHENYIQEIEFK